MSYLLTQRHQFVLKQISGEFPHKDFTAPLWWWTIPVRRWAAVPPLAVLLEQTNNKFKWKEFQPIQMWVRLISLSLVTNKICPFIWTDVLFLHQLFVAYRKGSCGGKAEPEGTVPPAAVGILCVGLTPAVLPLSACLSVRPRLLSDWIPLGVIDSDMRIREIRGAHWKRNKHISVSLNQDVIPF